MFSPRRAEAVRATARRAERTTPLYRSHLARLERKRKTMPTRPKRDHYDAKTYRTAVRRACVRAGVTPWHPHQLRYSAATRFRRKFGIEVARVLLGHRELATTEVYAERDVRTAMRAAGKSG